MITWFWVHRDLGFHQKSDRAKCEFLCLSVCEFMGQWAAYADENVILVTKISRNDE